ncbi:MAG: hypothetical protein RID53_02495 [Coleofasciculus sp. B1-GNL1-01]|uniref:hypothetical protein n=1 Tax=Coleofasciculus sp. B1-GNL1-01 TaxID=3068484 RepID=UPI0032FD9C72
MAYSSSRLKPTNYFYPVNCLDFIFLCKVNQDVEISSAIIYLGRSRTAVPLLYWRGTPYLMN